MSEGEAPKTTSPQLQHQQSPPMQMSPPLQQSPPQQVSPLPENPSPKAAPAAPPLTAPLATISPKKDYFLFSTPPKTGQWTLWIAKLLNNEPARDFVELNQLHVLCDKAREMLSTEPNMLPIEVEKDGKLLLVGDVHGQFRDMQTHILSMQHKAKEAHLPDYKFLFLGDYVDRGPNGVEVIILLLCLKLEYPDLIYLLRGNHEEAQTCRIYGFLQECRSKLHVSCWQWFNEVFGELPVAAVVQTAAMTFFCAHGGLSPKLDPDQNSLEVLQFLARNTYGRDFDNDNAQIIDGLLWSDPADHKDFHTNYRGCGFTFGADRSDAFCTSNGMRFICRAHQMVQTGYRWDHNNRVLTLFSAPNYCGINHNQAAIAIVDGARLCDDPTTFLEFIVYDVAEEPCEMYSQPASPGSKPLVPNEGEFPAEPEKLITDNVVKEYFKEPAPASSETSGAAQPQSQRAQGEAIAPRQ